MCDVLWAPRASVQEEAAGNGGKRRGGPWRLASGHGGWGGLGLVMVLRARFNVCDSPPFCEVSRQNWCGTDDGQKILDY